MSGRSRAFGASTATLARAAPRISRAASAVSWRISSTVMRGVDGHGGVGQRAQLLDVVVLEPGDLLDLGVAAVDALEGRQALAQEVRGGLSVASVGRRAALEHARSAAWCASARSSTLRWAATASRPRSYAAPSAGLAAVAQIRREAPAVARGESAARRSGPS